MTKSKKSIKSPTRRKRYKYPALEKSQNLLTRQDELDDILSYSKDVPDQMTEVILADGTTKMMNPKEWLNRFVEEEVHADFQHGGQILNRSKKDKKRVYNKNNARNRCIYTKEKAQGKLEYVEKYEDFEEALQNEVEEIKEEVWYDPKMKI